MSVQTVKLPNFIRNWPWQRRINPHYEQVKRAGRDWMAGFDFFDAKSQDAFERCDFARLAALTQPDVDAAALRTANDYVLTVYVLDEYSDFEDEHVTRKLADILMDGLMNPDNPRPQGEFGLGEMARQWWALGRHTATPMAERHMFETMQLYVDAVVQQSADRNQNKLRSFEDYIQLRRHSSGIYPTFVLCELDLDFPEEVYQHPLLQKMRDTACDNVLAINDIYSYRVERARGHALHNLVTIVMSEQNIDAQGAIDYIDAWNQELLQDMLRCKKSLPSWGADIDRQVQQYAEDLCHWLRGHDDWSFESQRYFGTRGAWMQEHREIIMPGLVDREDANSLTKHRQAEVDMEAEKDKIAALQIRRDLVVAGRQ
ncbi:terpenoid synthase [Podospora australis]|uniref:Terpene synthase n=1 Tax=Podospora australis TaxID=1536484 RepID=A0AAN6WS76_9PEZI|nr:terpenoid synthase [Podospora australis]